MNRQNFHSFKEVGKSMGVTEHHASTNSVSNWQQEKVSKKMPEFLKENADYVKIAEQKMYSLGTPNVRYTQKRNYRNLTTTKIRNILTLVNQLYNRIVLLSGDLPESIVSDIRYLKIRLVYESGREPDVMRFCKDTGIIDAIDFIGNSKPYFLRYAKYMEALVAYHRFYGGKD